tara:strand:- start:2001 stop:3740 length:1740 start_codon:yes stop_codon:yes gene_type:complete
METNTQNFNFFDLLKNGGGVDFAALVNNLTEGAEKGAEFWDKLFLKPMIFKQFESFEDSWKPIQEALEKKANGAVLSAWEKEALDHFTYRFGSDLDFDGFQERLFESNTRVEKVTSITDSLMNNIRDVINLGGAFKKDRLKVTDDKRGVFDFSLASQGLYRPVEFFSDSYTKRKGENEFSYTGEPMGVIPPERVYKDSSKAGLTIYFFEAQDGKRYTCERRQKGTTDVFENFRDECFLGQDKQGLVMPFMNDEPSKVFNGKKPHRLKYASSSKKVYLQFDKQEESTKYVDIFIPLNFLSDSNSSNKIFNLMTPLLAASALEEFGIKTRVNVIRNGQVDNEHFEIISIPLINYDESTREKIPLVINLMANDENSGAFFGFHLVTWANAGETQDKNGNPIVSGHLGRGLMPYYSIKDAVINIFMRYKNWTKLNQGKPYVNSKVLNENFQFFTYVALANEGQPFYNKGEMSADNISLQMPYVMYQFYWYMDYLSIEFLPMEKFIENLILRIEEDAIFKKLFIRPDRKELKEVIRAYVNNILVYKYFSSEQGALADTAMEKMEKSTRKAELRTQLDEVLKKKY